VGIGLVYGCNQICPGNAETIRYVAVGKEEGTNILN